MIGLKQDLRQPRVLDEHEYEALRQACNGHLRDRAVVEYFLQTGLSGFRPLYVLFTIDTRGSSSQG
jgi:hypothetical protein